MSHRRVVGILLVAFMVLSFSSLTVQTANAFSLSNILSLNQADAELTYVNVITQPLLDKNSTIFAGIVGLRTDKLSLIDFSLVNASLYDSGGYLLSNYVQPATSVATGIKVVSFRPLNTEGKFEIRVTVTWHTSWGSNVTKQSSGYVTLSGWNGLSLGVNNSFSSLSNKINGTSFDMQGLNTALSTFSQNMTLTIGRFMAQIQSLIAQNTVDPSFAFYYVNVPPYNSTPAQNAFRSGLDILALKNITWAMNNVTTMSALQTLITITNVSAAILVFSNATIPTPDSYNSTCWVLQIAGFSCRNSGNLAFFGDNWTARYFGYSNSTVKTDLKAYSYLLNATILVNGGPQVDRTAPTTGVYLNSGDMVNWIGNWFNVSLPNHVVTGYRAVPNYYYDLMNGLIIDYQKLYVYESDPVVYSLSNTVNRLFFSPFSNNQYNCWSLLGVMLYEFYHLYDTIMAGLEKGINDPNTTAYQKVWMRNETALMQTAWNNKNFTKLSLELANIQSFYLNLTSPTTGNLVKYCDSGYDYMNSTQADAATYEIDMTTANNTVCIQPTTSSLLNYFENAYDREQNFGAKVDPALYNNGTNVLGEFETVTGSAPNDRPDNWPNVAYSLTSGSVAESAFLGNAYGGGNWGTGNYYYYEQDLSLGTSTQVWKEVSRHIINPPATLSFAVEIENSLQAMDGVSPLTYSYVSMYDSTANKNIIYVFYPANQKHIPYVNSGNTGYMMVEIPVNAYINTATNWVQDYIEAFGALPNMGDTWYICLGQRVFTGASAWYHTQWQVGLSGATLPSSFSLQTMSVMLQNLFGNFTVNIDGNNSTFAGFMGFIKYLMRNPAVLNQHICNSTGANMGLISGIIIGETTYLVRSTQNALEQGIVALSAAGIVAALAGVFSYGAVGIGLALGAIALWITNWAGDALIAQVSSLVKGITGAITGVIMTITKLMTTMMYTLMSAISTLFNTLTGLMSRIESTIQYLFTKVITAVKGVEVYTTHNFDVIKNWSLGSLTLIKNGFNGVIGEAQQLENTLVLSSGFYSVVDGLRDQLVNVINSNQVIRYALDQLGPSTSLFLRSITAADGLSQVLRSRSGTQLFLFTPDTGLNTNKVYVFGAYNSTRLAGSGTYTLQSYSGGVVAGGSLAFVNGVSSVSIPASGDAYALNVTVGGKTIIGSLDKSTSQYVRDHAVYGNFAYILPGSATQGQSFQVPFILNNLRYSTGYATVRVDIVSPTWKIVTSAEQTVYLGPEASNTTVLTFNILDLLEAGNYSVRVTITDQITGSVFNGTSEDHLWVNGAIPAPYFAIGIGLGAAIVCVAIAVYAFRKLRALPPKINREVTTEAN